MFYQQFNQKLHFLTTGKSKRVGTEIKDAFVKITSGNFLDFKSLKSRYDQEDVVSMSESFHSPHFLQQRLNHDGSGRLKNSDEPTQQSSFKHPIDSSIEMHVDTSLSTNNKLSPRDRGD